MIPISFHRGLKSRFRRVLFGTILMPAALSGQTTASPFRLHAPREIAWYGGGGAAIGTVLLLKNKMPVFTPEQIAALNITDVPGFDRWAARQYSGAARRASDVFWIGSTALPLALMLDPAVRRDAGTVGVVMGEVLFLNTALTMLTKQTFKRPRPFVYNPDAPLSKKVERDARRSFFSGHTSTVAAMSFGTAVIWSAYHPDSRWKPVVWSVAAALPVATGYLRMRGGKHYLSDVVAGVGSGLLCGWLVPKLHRKKGR
jgi:membrane-associated phospholipid phosphatase